VTDTHLKPLQSPAVSDSASPTVTVVVPTLDEELRIESCLASIGCAPGLDVVVSDGRSRDRTLEIVADRPDVRVVEGSAGRGGQLNRGAAASRSDILVFLHADCRLPKRWYGAVIAALADDAVALTCFRLHSESTAIAGPVRRAWLRLLDIRSFVPMLPYGDQAFALSRSTFDRIGGFPDIPLMEDVALARSARRLGTIRRLPLEVHASARRVERHPYRNRLMTGTFPILYRLGVSPWRLAAWYRDIR
jgi:rSAM/selenodomain-associated transferase 2